MKVYTGNYQAPQKLHGQVQEVDDPLSVMREGPLVAVLIKDYNNRPSLGSKRNRIPNSLLRRKLQQSVDTNDV